YDARNKPFLDFNGMIAEAKNPAGAFVYDDRAFANIIRGNPQTDNPKDKGHFHEVSGEFWFILEGQIEYKIGSLPIFLADQGDIVYAPKGMWHRAHHGGMGKATRLAINGYLEMLHNYKPNEELRYFTVGAVYARAIYCKGFDACNNKARGHRPRLQQAS